MKKALLSLVFCLNFSAFALECTQLEAQFIGKVVDFQKVRVDQYLFDCSYKISFHRFDSSMVCPLDIDEVLSVRFDDYNCELNDGDMVSGYLVKSLQTGQIVIE